MLRGVKGLKPSASQWQLHNWFSHFFHSSLKVWVWGLNADMCCLHITQTVNFQLVEASYSCIQHAGEKVLIKIYFLLHTEYKD